MIALEKFKKLLGAETVGLSDEELERTRAEMYQLADLAFDKWVKDKGLDAKIGKISQNKL